IIVRSSAAGLGQMSSASPLICQPWAGSAMRSKSQSWPGQTIQPGSSTDAIFGVNSGHLETRACSWHKGGVTTPTRRIDTSDLQLRAWGLSGAGLHHRRAGVARLRHVLRVAEAVVQHRLDALQIAADDRAVLVRL